MAQVPARARALRAHLLAGGLVAYATRGCFGLGCLPWHVPALRRLVRLKRRPLHKGLIVVSDRLDRLRGLVAPLGAELEARARTRWPGHWTWIVPATRRAPPQLRGRHRALAVRVDNYSPVVQLCRAVRLPLVSTSANRSGEPPRRTTRAVRQAFGHAAWVVPGRCEPGSRPSTVADLRSGRILRA